MPSDWKQGLGFLIGFAIVLWLGPLVITIARGETPDQDLRNYEKALLSQVNEIRAEYHRTELVRKPALDAVARKHSEDMAARGFFAHENPDGETPLHRIQAGQISNFSLAAENLGKTNAKAPTREILNGWMFSREHRNNLLSPPFNATGIGVAREPGGSLLFTQVYVTLER